MRPLLDAITLLLSRVLARVFYRSVEVTGLEHVPAVGPVLFVANHANSLVDPLLLYARLPRRARFLAKATLWKNPVVMPLLVLAGAVPVYRRQDGGDMTQNQDTFARCFEELEGDGAIALFPEGISYHAPELQPLKTGAARIALGARRDDAPLPVPVIPVGLTFEDKSRFRSRVLIVVGEPIDTGEELALAAQDSREAARHLTERIQAGLEQTTLNFPTWERAQIVEHAASILAVEGGPLPGQPELAEHFTIRRAMGEAYDEARAKHPERIARIEQRAERYDGMLTALGIRDDHVLSDYPFEHALTYVTDRLAVLLATAPLAIVGTLLNYIPYRVPGLVGRLGREHGDLPATYKIMTGLLLFPLTWAFWSWCAGAWWGVWGALAMACFAPLSGYVAILFHERNGSLWREVWAWWTLRRKPERTDELRTLREEIRAEVAALVALESGA
jgi:1-acyl-sn-glycerol-3-phosphate acyltransferase